jgi:hypothetical protein
MPFPSLSLQDREGQGIGDVFISPVLGDVPSMEGMVYGMLFTGQSVINAQPSECPEWHAKLIIDGIKRRSPHFWRSSCGLQNLLM